MRIKNIAFILFSICAIMAFTGCNEEKKVEKPKTFTYERISHSKGLPNDNITCLSAYDGKVWAGSNKGVFIHDGVNWEINNSKNCNALGSDLIVSLQSVNGRMWVATDNGACYYDSNGFHSIYTGGRARAVSGTKDGKYAVGTAYGVIVNGSNTGSNIASHEISSMLCDSQGKLYVGTRKEGCFKIESGSSRNYKGPAKSIMGSSLIEIPASPSNCRLPGNLIKTMIPFRKSIAIGTTSGLCITDFDNNYEVYTAEHKDFFQRGGKIVEELVNGNSKIPGNKIYSLAATDKDELLFVVTDLGLGILKGKEWLDVEKIIPGLPSSGINSVAWCNGDLWLGTEDEGLIKVAKFSDYFADDTNKK